MNVVGKTDNIQPGGSADLTVDLSAFGAHVLICNLPSHYQNGMYAQASPSRVVPAHPDGGSSQTVGARNGGAAATGAITATSTVTATPPVTGTLSVPVTATPTTPDGASASSASAGQADPTGSSEGARPQPRRQPPSPFPMCRLCLGPAAAVKT
ncbi:MAG: hypothetical protein R3A10_04455 [Caldilineaceae bacterium]